MLTNLTRSLPGTEKLILFILAALWLGTGTATAATLDEVKDRGALNCGVSEGLAGFSEQVDGQWRGFDVDFCRAVAAATVGDADAVNYIALSALDRFDALTAGDIDLLSRNSTWTFSRDVDLALEFIGAIYYDGQGFMLPVLYGVTNPLQLEGASICVVSGTTSQANAEAYYSRAGMSVSVVPFENRDDARAAYEAGECDTFTADRSALFADRTLLDDPEGHVVLADVISKEPLSPVVRDDDAEWRDIVRWTLFGLINAEEQELSAQDGAVLEAMGAPAEGGLRLSPTWLVDVIGAVGTYSDIYERHLGENTSLGIRRGVNALWTRGGLIYAPPMQ